MSDLDPTKFTALAVLIPCYNAGKRLRPVLERVLAVLPTVILVNDGSTDGCTEGLDDLPLHRVEFPRNRGKGHALLEGFRAALENDAVQAVCVVDADGQHNPDELQRLYEAFRREDADLVIGSRVFTGQHVPWASRFGNTTTIAVTTLLLGQRLPDTQSGFRLHSRRFLESVLETVAPGRYETEMEILVKAVREGFRVLSVPIETIYEPGNPSSHFGKVQDSIRIYARLFKASMRYRSTDSSR